eukprot:TRINITY_DN1150_c0_g1_i4.p1 TRINITY_DN1150_c0_g1~~TRINITY_DN1150_c0_g1_i4.p1  ORF type:complete len:358 (+),score=34.62 TRINITY_DN1150_c0_g1_i4:46-1119(+)
MSINCTEYPNECEEQRVIFVFLIALIGTLSCLGSVSIMVTIFWFRLYDKLKHRMILYLSIADVLQSFASVTNYAWLNVVPTVNDTLCYVQGFMFNFTNLTSSFWNANTCLFVTVFIVSTAIVGTKNLPGKKYELFSSMLWLFGLFLSVYGPTLVTEEKPYYYGPISNGVYCWVLPDWPTERMTLHYLWMFISLGLMIVLTTLNLVYLCCRSGKFGSAIDKKVNGLIVTLVGYPIIYSFVFMPLTILRAITGLGIVVPVEIVWIAVIMLVGNGILNALYYGISRNLYQKWRLELSGKTYRGKYSKSKSTDNSRRSQSRSQAASRHVSSNKKDNQEIELKSEENRRKKHKRHREESSSV